MARAPDRPSIMDSPSAQRAVIGAGALLATVGAAFFFAQRNKSDPNEKLVSDAPKWTLRWACRDQLSWLWSARSPTMKPIP